MNPSPLFQNYQTKLAVLGLAFILWLTVKLNRTYDYAVEVPLQITTNNPEYCLKYPIPRKVRVQFVGKGMDLLRLRFYRLAYRVDLSDVTKRRVINLSEHPEFVSYPEELDVSVKSIIRPIEMVFEVDHCKSTHVPVVVQATVTTLAGYTLVAMTPKPDSVLVSGPASFVDTLQRVFTEKKTLRDLNLPRQETFKLLPSSVFEAHYEPEQVTVYFDVQRIAEKELENVPVRVTNVPPDLEVLPLPSFVRLYIRGGEKILAQARPEDFQVVIDFKRSWKPGAKQIKGRIVTPYKLLYMESQPSHFELVVQKKRLE
ncbi:MAG: YbbR-like domain-containing protein [Calditrichaeota bacterium]|nr:MAG: YbbR-like domain-containing protein [Calditrichota bacterium]